MKGTTALLLILSLGSVCMASESTKRSCLNGGGTNVAGLSYTPSKECDTGVTHCMNKTALGITHYSCGTTESLTMGCGNETLVGETGKHYVCRCNTHDNCNNTPRIEAFPLAFMVFFVLMSAFFAVY